MLSLITLALASTALAIPRYGRHPRPHGPRPTGGIYPTSVFPTGSGLAFYPTGTGAAFPTGTGIPDELSALPISAPTGQYSALPIYQDYHLAPKASDIDTEAESTLAPPLPVSSEFPVIPIVSGVPDLSELPSVSAEPSVSTIPSVSTEPSVSAIPSVSLEPLTTANGYPIFTPVPIPSGVFPSSGIPSGVFPSGGVPSGVFPSGVIPTGVFPSGTGAIPTGYNPATLLTFTRGPAPTAVPEVPVENTEDAEEGYGSWLEWAKNLFTGN